MSRIFDLSGNHMNSLVSLSMDMRFRALPENYVPFKFDDVPKLQEFTLSGLDTLTLDSFVQLPWQRLTKLHITNVILSHGSGHEVLQHCRSLISCTFTIESDDGDSAVPDEIIMAYLEVLEVTAFDVSGSYGGFFRVLVTPLLKDFSLISEDDTYWLDEELTSFISLHVRWKISALLLTGRTSTHFCMQCHLSSISPIAITVAQKCCEK